MGWNIDHAPYDETFHRSALQLENLSKQVAHVTTGAKWRIVLPLFDQAQNAPGPFEFSWREAGPIADVLRLAACHALMPDDWAQDAHKLADAADTAAKRRESWRWS
jgi:hypothetical protein